ncbi:MAG: RsmE family RNA methyltransferase [Candidatus Omnitrophica bacterium]|nr:RsmE family RNA methyltransferase [Candidatus Omnitrophota bacterium]
MSRIRIYLDSNLEDTTLIIKDIKIMHKLRDILRLKAGEIFYVFNGRGVECSYKITEVKQGAINASKMKLERVEKKENTRIILGFPLVKEEKADFILQKATELGVSEFIPFVCERSIQALPSQHKIIRWRTIISEAARQSDRIWIPMLNDVCNLKEITARIYECKLFAALGGENLTRAISKLPSKEVLIIVGPEGDFSSQEYQHLLKNNFAPINLSPNILRVETASILAVGLINHILNIKK